MINLMENDVLVYASILHHGAVVNRRRAGIVANERCQMDSTLTQLE